MYSLNWLSVMWKVSRIHARIWSIPSRDWSTMSSSCAENCEPMKVIRPPMMASVPRTVIAAAAPRGRRVASLRVIGSNRAHRRMPTITGTTISDMALIARAATYSPSPMISSRNAHSLASRTPLGTAGVARVFGSMVTRGSSPRRIGQT
jgi:hypothetical protein